MSDVKITEYISWLKDELDGTKRMIDNISNTNSRYVFWYGYFQALNRAYENTINLRREFRI